MPRLLRSLCLLAAALGLLALGCAREGQRPRSAPGASAAGWVVPNGYAWPPRVVTPSEAGPASLKAPATEGARSAPVAAKTAQPGPKALPADRVAELYPGGSPCLGRLERAGVRFRPSDPKKGVSTPVLIDGAIGGIDFWTHGGGPMIVDCRFALALADVAPELRELGVTRVRFSGAYVYRLSRVGRLSLHAHGLALDVHEVSAFGRSFDVKRDFARGLASGCDAGAPLLNRIACRLRQRRLFKELLTPDDNADHHDHLHLAIAPEP